MGVELERRLRCRKRGGELPGVQLNGVCPGFVYVPFGPARHGHRCERQVEPTRDRARKHRQRLVALRHQQHIAAQVEQPGKLVAPADRFFCPRTRDRRQIAGDQADGKKSQKSHPVLRVGDRERAHWRKKEEVEAEHGDH